MKSNTRLHAPNSLVLVTTGRPPDVPDAIDPRQLVAATSNCLAVGTIAEDDGVVEVWLSDEQNDDPQLNLAGTFVMNCSTGAVAVETVLEDELLRQNTPYKALIVRIWVSDMLEPTKLFIEFHPDS